MHFDLRAGTDQGLIISKRPTPLAALPSPSEVTFCGRPPWSPVPTSTITAALGVDPGSWNVWRNRRITPPPLPAAWFRRATGQPLIYRVDHILSWLAARRGEPFDTPTTWWSCLRTEFEADVTDPVEVRKLARLYARAAGPKVGDVTFTPAGFQSYLDSLAA